MWYDSLEVSTTYTKQLGLINRFYKEFSISGNSKRWWDKDLKIQLTKVHQLGRGGQGALVKHTQPER